MKTVDFETSRMEADPTTRSPIDAAEEVRRVGSTVLRQAWRLDLLHQVREAIVRYDERRAARAAAGATHFVRLYHEHGVGVFEWLVAEKLVDRAILREMFAGSFYHELCKAFFDDDALYVAPQRIGFRLHDPSRNDRSFVPYHQDRYGQDPRVRSVLNCWIPLDPGAGRDAPGLEVVRHIGERDFPRKDFSGQTVNAVYDELTIDPDRIAADYGGMLLAPVFDLGDGLVFSENVIHRTFVTPGMTKPRIGFEFRVFSLKHLEADASLDEVRASSYRIA